MDEKNENQEMMELVSKTLLFEVYKYGQVEQSESAMINNLGSVLNVSRERFSEIIEQLILNSSEQNLSIEHHHAGCVEIFVSVRAKLVSCYLAEKTEQYLEKLAIGLGLQYEFAESLSVGF